MGIFDDMFDFNGDGHVDGIEQAMGMEMLYELDQEEQRQNDSYYDDDDSSDDSDYGDDY